MGVVIDRCITNAIASYSNDEGLQLLVYCDHLLVTSFINSQLSCHVTTNIVMIIYTYYYTNNVTVQLVIKHYH